MTRYAAARAWRDVSNRWFTAAVIGGGGVLGSGITFLVLGGILWNAVAAGLGRVRMDLPAAARLIALSFAFYFLADLISALVNQPDFEGARQVATNIPFLGFALLFASLRSSSREAILDSVRWGVIAGALAMGALGAYQVFVLFHGRAEAMAGNAGPLAVVASVLLSLSFVMMQRDGILMKALCVAAAFASALTIVLTSMRTLFPMLLVAPMIPIACGLVVMKAAPLARYLSVVALVVLSVAVPFYPWIEARIATGFEEFAATRTTEPQDAPVEQPAPVPSAPAADAAPSVEPAPPPAPAAPETPPTAFQDTSVGHRIFMWTLGWDFVLESPVVGHGPGSIPQLLAERAPLEYSHLHNFLLTAQVRSGIPGSLAILGILAAPLVVAWRSRRRDDTARFGCAIVVAVVATYACSGTLNIMLGHDILDSLYIFAVVVGAYLLFGSPAALPAADMSTGARESAQLFALPPGRELSR